MLSWAGTEFISRLFKLPWRSCYVTIIYCDYVGMPPRHPRPQNTKLIIWVNVVSGASKECIIIGISRTSMIQFNFTKHQFWTCDVCGTFKHQRFISYFVLKSCDITYILSSDLYYVSDMPFGDNTEPSFSHCKTYWRWIDFRVRSVLGYNKMVHPRCSNVMTIEEKF